MKTIGIKDQGKKEQKFVSFEEKKKKSNLGIQTHALKEKSFSFTITTQSFKSRSQPYIECRQWNRFRYLNCFTGFFIHLRVHRWTLQA